MYIKKLKICNEIKPVYGLQILGIDRVNAPRLVTILPKNREGLKNINHIMTLGCTKEIEGKKLPCVSYEDILSNREGVLIGLECMQPDLYQVFSDDEKDHEGEKLNALLADTYSIADYVEIKPWRFYIDVLGEFSKHKSDMFGNAETIIKVLLNELAFALKKENILPVAADDALEFLTSREILADYIFPQNRRNLLGPYPDLARELVLSNPIALAAMIDDDISQCLKENGG